MHEEVEIKSERLLDSPIVTDTVQSKWIDTKAETNKRSNYQVLNMIRELVFNKRLIEIEASQVEYRLNKFWLGLSDDDSITGKLHGYSSVEQVYSRVEETLKRRYKRQRLSTSEKLHIYNQVVNLKTPIRSIIFDYHLSETTVLNIVKKTEEAHLSKTSMSSGTKRILMSSTLVKDKIACFLDLNRNPITAKRVAMYVFKETGIRLPIHLVRNYLKEDLKLSYKIGKSRPALYDFDKNMILKSYFAIRVIKLLPLIDVIVNIDEAWFSRTTVAKRSWLRRGMDETITNIKHSGSLSLISAITSSGWSFNATVTGSINSKIFINYLKQILSFLTEQHGVRSERTLIVMDNASTHKAGIVKEFLNSWGTFVAFIPPYSPELAPVEKYFGVLKSLVNKSNTTLVISWRSKEGIALIARWIKRVDPIIIKRMWRTFFKEMQISLDHLSNFI